MDITTITGSRRNEPPPLPARPALLAREHRPAGHPRLRPALRRGQAGGMTLTVPLLVAIPLVVVGALGAALAVALLLVALVAWVDRR